MANRLPLIDEEGEVRELTKEDFARAAPPPRSFPKSLALKWQRNSLNEGRTARRRNRGRGPPPSVWMLKSWKRLKQWAKAGKPPSIMPSKLM
jgi:hypothetical protein